MLTTLSLNERGPGLALALVTVTLAGACGETSAPPPPVAHVQIVPDSPTVGVRDTIRFGAILTDASGHTLTGRLVTWTSLAPVTLSIDSGGLAFGLRKGTAGIRATAEGKTATVTATVRFVFALVANGTDYSCGVTTGHQAFCWGGNSQGQLGTGIVGDTSLPALVADSGPITGLSGNKSSGTGRHTCALQSSASATCWGTNIYGELGDASYAPSAVPVQVSAITSLAAIAVGNAHSCALSSLGKAYCWGWNADGQLGTGDTTTRDSPVAVVGGLVFTTLALGTYHSCGIAASSHVYCWGGNPDREYGIDTTGASLVPHLASDTLLFGRIAAGTYHSCGLTTDGRAFCWGGNHEGQLGTGDTASALTPQPVAGGHLYAEIAAGSYHTCAVATTGTTYCWGYNATSQLGIPSTTQLSRIPVATFGSIGFVGLSAGYGHTCGLTSGGDLYCWGDNSAGQLGNGTRIGGPTPVMVSSP
jgi:alpha-tubulin suppressor-like RCC1 family protein